MKWHLITDTFNRPRPWQPNLVVWCPVFGEVKRVVYDGHKFVLKYGGWTVTYGPRVPINNNLTEYGPDVHATHWAEVVGPEKEQQR